MCVLMFVVFFLFCDFAFLGFACLVKNADPYAVSFFFFVILQGFGDSFLCFFFRYLARRCKNEKHENADALSRLMAVDYDHKRENVDL